MIPYFIHVRMNDSPPCFLPTEVNDFSLRTRGESTASHNFAPETIEKVLFRFAFNAREKNVVSSVSVW